MDTHGLTPFSRQRRIQTSYGSMPASIRAYDSRTADYALVVVRDFQKSDREYVASDSLRSVGAFDAYAEIYLCGTDGTLKLLGRIVNAPGLSAEVSKRTMGGVDMYGSVYADRVSQEQIWREIERFF